MPHMRKGNEQLVLLCIPFLFVVLSGSDGVSILWDIELTISNNFFFLEHKKKSTRQQIEQSRSWIFRWISNKTRLWRAACDSSLPLRCCAIRTSSIAMSAVDSKKLRRGMKYTVVLFYADNRPLVPQENSTHHARMYLKLTSPVIIWCIMKWK